MMIGKLNKLTRVDLQVVANQREFVRKGNIYIAKTVFSELHKLGCPGRGNEQFTLTKGSVEY